MSETAWWKKKVGCGEVHSSVIRYVQGVDRQQSAMFDRFVKLAYLYDPNDRQHTEDLRRGPDSQVTENVIASNVDTVYAVTATAGVRPRFMTDDADWSTQRRARHLGWYSEGIMKTHDVLKKCRRAFKDAALKGTGVVKVYVDRYDRIRVDRVRIDDIVVDNGEARAKEPTQMHHRQMFGADELISMYPEHETAIMGAKGSAGDVQRYWADYRPIDRDDVVVVESWKLPMGVKGKDGYVPGRHVICIDGADLVDEEWSEDFFPFAVIRWAERDASWYGLSLAERIVGHQRQLNKMHWQIDRQNDQIAVPTTYIRYADAGLAIRTTNRAGTFIPIKGDYPKTVIPTAVGDSQWMRLDQVSAKAAEETGVNKMIMHGTKPSRLESGAALREYKDQTTQRFAPQEIALEGLVLDVVQLMLWCCKILGDDAPEPVRKSRFGPRPIKWADVDMGDVKIQIEAASDLARTPAGRTQLAMEWAQAGVISMDEARRLMRHPDTEKAISLYTAAVEHAEFTLEEMFDGNVMIPSPYQNLKMCVWRCQQGILEAEPAGAPEEIIEIVQNFITQAATIIANSNAQALPEAGPEAAMPGAGPVDGDAGPSPMAGAGVVAADLMR